MPVVQVSIWAGRGKDFKKKIAEGMTKVLTDLGVPSEAVTIIFNEIPKTNWATAGELHSERFPDR